MMKFTHDSPILLTGATSDLAKIEGVASIYFGMSVLASYLEATVNIAAVARHNE